MNRLTKKKDKHYVYIHNEFHNIGEHVDKLGQLEDIEEELGIDLITLYKALKDGVYCFAYGTQLITKDYVYLIDNYPVSYHESRKKLSYSFLTSLGVLPLFFSDYGKTWALTEGELKNGN